MSLILANEVVYGFFGAARMRLGSVCNRNCSSVLGRVLVSLKARQSCEKVKAKGPDNLGRPAVRRDRSAASECFGAMFRSLSGLLIRFDCAADNGIFKPQKVKEFPDLFPGSMSRRSNGVEARISITLPKEEYLATASSATTLVSKAADRPKTDNGGDA